MGWSARRFSGRVNNAWRCGTIRDGIQCHVTGHTFGIGIDGYVNKRGEDRFDVHLIRVGRARNGYGYYYTDRFEKQEIGSYTFSDIPRYFTTTMRVRKIGKYFNGIIR